MSEGREVCPTCGRTINWRDVNLFTGMVHALWLVFKWCEENGVHEFKKKDIRQFLDSSATGNFHYWRWGGGLVYNPDGINGHYGLNMDRCRDFFAGRLKVPTVFRVSSNKNDPNRVILDEYATIDNIPNLTKFLDENENYIATYCNREPVQTELL